MKCFTYDQARIIIQDLSSIPIKDSIIATQEQQVQVLYDKTQELYSQIHAYEDMDSLRANREANLEGEVQDLQKDLGKCRKRGKTKTVIFTCVGTVVGFILNALLP